MPAMDSQPGHCLTASRHSFRRAAWCMPTVWGFTMPVGPALNAANYAPPALRSKAKKRNLTQTGQHPLDRHGMPLAAGGRRDLAGIQLDGHLPVRHAGEFGEHRPQLFGSLERLLAIRDALCVEAAAYADALPVRQAVVVRIYGADLSERELEEPGPVDRPRRPEKNSNGSLSSAMRAIFRCRRIASRPYFAFKK